ncbi:hypothetical protein DFJ63DRAFT_132785 [Scheffersomyces coipomensis]|uniref:uncharacterized protein n=1 Tax=Scheffersomyces coipomensis TaxID=1788519 RepID=UPI00315DA1F7
MSDSTPSKFPFFLSAKAQNMLKSLYIPKWTILISNFAIVIYDIIFNVLDLTLCLYYTHTKASQTVPYSLGSLIIGVVILIHFLAERLSVGDTVLSRSKQWKKYMELTKYSKFGSWIFFFLITVLKVQALSSGKVQETLSDDSSTFPFSANLAYIILNCISVAFDSILLSVWWEKSLKSIYILFRGCQMIQILFSIAIIQANINVINTDNIIVMKRVHNLFICTATFFITQSGNGLGISFIVNKGNRLNDITGKFLAFFNLFASCLLLVVIACFIMSIYYFNTSENNEGDISISVPILFGCNIFFDFVSIYCTRHIRAKKPLIDLLVEEYDLSALTNQQKAGWSKLINLNSRYNGGISGDRMISLMENYAENKTLSGVKFKVLRVYKKAPSPLKNQKQNNNNKDKDLEKMDPKENKITKLTSSVSSSDQSSDNDDSTAWDPFDKESLVFSSENSRNMTSDQTLDEFKPLSKNQLKKLAKKKSKQQSMEELETIQRNSEKFYDELRCTEALVLLTIIDSFDLTERIPGKFGKKLSQWFGKDSKLPLLCIKFGLVGFHWPFKRSTVYCSSTKKPVARSAAIMYAMAKWNKSNEKCTVLLDPTYKDDFAEPGIRLGGWYKVILPNSHVIDLRPFMNKTIDQYYKAVKYRNHDNVFLQENGQVIETFDFNEENCSNIIKLTELISDSRQNSGRSDTLLKPTTEFISHFGNFANENNFRSLVFLKVNDELVASCVIFRLGDTITSDIQGLNHEISKKYRAYFVMMQEVIKIALREKVSFVDFGPTTENAKVDIGCKVVPLVGSLSARNPLLSPLLQFAASKVNV